MPRKDFYHETVIATLVEDGWSITHDPYRIELDEAELLIDLAAEKNLIGAQKAETKIAVEIKNFLSSSDVNELQKAIGQYDTYEFALQNIEPSRELYLAIPSAFHRRLSKMPFFTRLIDHKKIRLLIFDEETKSILKWKK